jgi:hypothetical protein
MNEMISDPDQKIGRPRQLYTGVVPPAADRKPLSLVLMPAPAPQSAR